MSTDLVSKMDEIIEKANMPDRNSFFQIEKFIIGTQPTAQAQLWAIVRELDSRKEQIQAIEKDLLDAEDNLELISINMEKIDREIRILSKITETDNPFVDLNIREKEINIKKLEREKKSLISASQKLNKKLKCIFEEVNCFILGYEKITNICGPIKPVDDPEAQKEMWNEKFLEEFNLRIILNKPFDTEFVKHVLYMDDKSTVKKQMINMIDQIQNNMSKKKEFKAQPKIGGQ